MVQLPAGEDYQPTQFFSGPEFTQPHPHAVGTSCDNLVALAGPLEQPQVCARKGARTAAGSGPALARSPRVAANRSRLGRASAACLRSRALELVQCPLLASGRSCARRSAFPPPAPAHTALAPRAPRVLATPPRWHTQVPPPMPTMPTRPPRLAASTGCGAASAAAGGRRTQARSQRPCRDGTGLAAGALPPAVPPSALGSSSCLCLLLQLLQCLALTPPGCTWGLLSSPLGRSSASSYQHRSCSGPPAPPRSLEPPTCPAHLPSFSAAGQRQPGPVRSHAAQRPGAAATAAADHAHGGHITRGGLAAAARRCRQRCSGDQRAGGGCSAWPRGL